MFINTELCDTNAAWQYYEGTGHCYRFFDHRGIFDPGATHAQAEASCIEEGGQLFSSNSFEEMEFVTQTILL